MEEMEKMEEMERRIADLGLRIANLFFERLSDFLTGLGGWNRFGGMEVNNYEELRAMDYREF